jgi:uncharacterized membrane protein YhaH (DUF805 family)
MVIEQCGSADSRTHRRKFSMVAILWAVLAVILAVWLVGLLAGAAGNLIHLLLIVALAVLIYNLLTGRSVA